MRIGKAVLTAAALAAAAAYTRRAVRETERGHPPTGRFVTIRQGVRLHYERHGRGRPVILLHGAFTQLQDMTSSLLPVLTENCEVFAFDRPGHGYSQKLPGRATVRAQARAIHDAARLLRLERPVVVGHSAGAAVALAYGAMFPRDAAGIVFLSGAAYPEIPRGAWTLAGASLPLVGGLLAHTIYQPLQPRLTASTMRKLFAPQAVPPHLTRTLSMEMLCRPAAIMANAGDQLVALPSLIDVQRSYAHYPLPVVIFAGMEDRILDPQRHAVRLSKRLPGAELHLLAGLGHMAHHFVQDEIGRAVETMVAIRPSSPPV